MKTTFALIAAALFFTASAFADGGCCASRSDRASKMECAKTYAKLNLAPKQKTRLEALQAQCDKNGCTKESMDKFIKSAKGILSKEQFAMLKTECARMHHGDKTRI